MITDYDANPYFLAQHERRRYPPAVLTCSVCGEDIYEGDRYWEPFGKAICGSCLYDVGRVAEAYDEESEVYGVQTQ